MFKPISFSNASTFCASPAFNPVTSDSNAPSKRQGDLVKNEQPFKRSRVESLPGNASSFKAIQKPHLVSKKRDAVKPSETCALNQQPTTKAARHGDFSFKPITAAVPKPVVGPIAARPISAVSGYVQSTMVKAEPIEQIGLSLSDSENELYLDESPDDVQFENFENTLNDKFFCSIKNLHNVGSARSPGSDRNIVSPAGSSSATFSSQSLSLSGSSRSQSS